MKVYIYLAVFMICAKLSSAFAVFIVDKATAHGVYVESFIHSHFECPYLSCVFRKEKIGELILSPVCKLMEIKAKSNHSVVELLLTIIVTFKKVNNLSRQEFRKKDLHINKVYYVIS